MHGKIELPAPPMLPQALLDLLFGDDDLSKNFRENIRAYNSMFAFTSMGGKIDASINTGRGPNVFRLIGQNFHKIGSLLPPDGAPPKFQQLYIFDTVNENVNRISAFSEKSTTPSSELKTLRDDIVEAIKIMLNECNPYAKILRTARDRFGDSLESSKVKVKLISRRSTDSNTYNMPTSSEVAALLVDDFDENFEVRDIVVETKSKNLARISELHPAYLPLQYPLLFPYGEDGYHIDLQLKKTTTSTFVGSPRYMHEKYMDAMAVCSHIGYPDLFITFTCNPKWPKSDAEIEKKVSRYHRPYIELHPDLLTSFISS